MPGVRRHLRLPRLPRQPASRCMVDRRLRLVAGRSSAAPTSSGCCWSTTTSAPATSRRWRWCRMTGRRPGPGHDEDGARGDGGRTRGPACRGKPLVPLERLALSPQCGFATSVAGNAITAGAQRAKLALLVRAARDFLPPEPGLNPGRTPRRAMSGLVRSRARSLSLPTWGGSATEQPAAAIAGYFEASPGAGPEVIMLAAPARPGELVMRSCHGFRRS